jgi:hypothetical protein
VTLTLIFCSLPILESQFLKHGGIRQSYGSKATEDGRVDEILESQLLETKNAGKSI